MGLPGLAVAFCFATASTSFVVALAYTTVANIVLMQAGVPLLAALHGLDAVSRKRVAARPGSPSPRSSPASPSWSRIRSTATVSPIGDGLALLIAVAFSTATVITRRYAHVRMTPATCLGTIIAARLRRDAGRRASRSSTPDMAWLFAFGALNLGLGLALFATGARLIPAAFAALLGTFETVLGPIWVWLIHGEVPSTRTIIGGAVIFAALLVHIGLEFRRQPRPRKPGVTGMPSPN